MEELSTRQKLAKNAWNTRRLSKKEKTRNQHSLLNKLPCPKEETFEHSNIKIGEYKISGSLIKPSKLTSKSLEVLVKNYPKDGPSTLPSVAPTVVYSAMWIRFTRDMERNDTVLLLTKSGVTTY